MMHREGISPAEKGILEGRVKHSFGIDKASTSLESIRDRGLSLVLTQYLMGPSDLLWVDHCETRL